MSGIDNTFAKTLDRFDFHKHKAHRWLLLDRQRRESILREAGLLDVIQWQESPVHVGNIARVEQAYDWGHVVFHGVVSAFDDEPPCSVYAAFEYLILKCDIFPSFISLADLKRCEKMGLHALPVYGSSFSLEGLDANRRQACLNKMRQLHGIDRHDELLIEHVSEVTDAELFESYFRQVIEQKDAQEKRRKGGAGDAASGFDDLDVWHT